MSLANSFNIGFGSMLGLVAIAVSMLGMTTTPNTCACQLFVFTTGGIASFTGGNVFSVSFTPLQGFTSYNITVWASVNAKGAFGAQFDGAGWIIILKRTLPIPVATYQQFSDYHFGDQILASFITDDVMTQMGGETKRMSFLAQTIVWQWATSLGGPIELVAPRMIVQVSYS